MWITQWRLHLRYHWRWWVVGFCYDPGWIFTLCLGPMGIELSKTQTHI